MNFPHLTRIDWHFPSRVPELVVTNIARDAVYIIRKDTICVDNLKLLPTKGPHRSRSNTNEFANKSAKYRAKHDRSDTR